MTDPVGTAVTIVARRIGYSSQRADVHVGDENVSIKLTSAAVSLNEVVVTGTPGSTERRALGVDVAQIDASTLVNKAPINDVQSLLNGRTPGVTLLANSGVVGAGSTVRIRGVSSFSLTNQPLIYVDGVRVDNSQSTGVQNQSFGAATTTRWNDFNPDDIESIEIVKGPAATTLYGTEAANGVIQIITKKGAIGKTTWDFNTRQGANWFSNPQGRLWTNFDTNADGDTVSVDYTQLEKNLAAAGHGADFPDRPSAGIQSSDSAAARRCFATTSRADTKGTRVSSRRTTTTITMHEPVSASFRTTSSTSRSTPATSSTRRICPRKPDTAARRGRRTSRIPRTLVRRISDSCPACRRLITSSINSSRRSTGSPEASR